VIEIGAMGPSSAEERKGEAACRVKGGSLLMLMCTTFILVGGARAWIPNPSRGEQKPRSGTLVAL
jgi:hypothetical protein